MDYNEKKEKYLKAHAQLKSLRLEYEECKEDGKALRKEIQNIAGKLEELGLDLANAE